MKADTSAQAPKEAGQPAKDDDFVAVDHEDVDMRDHETGLQDHHPPQDLELHRFGNNLEDVDDDDEDDDDEPHNNLAQHPLLGMLSGRLGQRRRGSFHKYDHLHPENQILSIANVDDCVQVEAAFPEHERCTREKLEYRLTKCPELSLGLFTQPTLTEAARQKGPAKRKLVAHIIATRTAAPAVTDASMTLPKDWQTKKPSASAPGADEPEGHQETGGTVCIHSLAVLPDLQGLGLGTVLLKSYIARIKDSKCATRLALLAHDHLVKWYAGFGFEDMGPSDCQFGGGGWNNLVLEFSAEDEE